MEREAEAIRRLVGARRKQSYTAELRARIVRHVRQRRTQGFTQAAVADEVGVKWTTLRRWLGEGGESTPAMMIPVTLAAAPVPCSKLSLVTPSGYRLEGLDSRDAVALFRAL